MIEKTEWWKIIGTYLSSISPAQFIFFIAALFLLLLLFGKHHKLASRLINLYLVFSFLWVATVFFLGFGRGVTGETYGNYFFSVVFSVIAVFYFLNVIKQKTIYDLNTPIKKLAVLAMVLFYPIIGLITHKDILLSSFVGTMPCPTVALALLLLVFAKVKPPAVVLVLLLLWAIPSTPFLQIGRYGVYEDFLLFFSGVFFLIHWILERRQKLAIQ